MSMSRKHYESIAAIIRRHAQVEAANSNQASVTQSVANDMAAYFKAENQRFNTSAFIKACGLPTQQA